MIISKAETTARHLAVADQPKPRGRNNQMKIRDTSRNKNEYHV